MQLSIDQKDIDKFIMIGDKVLIKPKNPQSQTKSGLYLPPTVQQDKIQSGYIIKVGPGFPLPSQKEEHEVWEKKKEGEISLKCKNVVFTGPLSSMSRGEAIGNVIRCGGFVSSSVSKKTNYLVTGIRDLSELKENEKSIKLKKAENLIKENFDIKIINEEEFLSIIE